MSSKTKEQNCKVVLLGDSGVGKTCIINRYISGSFNQLTPSTNGASFTCKVVYVKKIDQNISLDIWDTAGQEKFRSLTKFFYKDAQVAILVYDITKRESFINMKEYWYQTTNNELVKSNLIFGVAANKSDLYENEEVNENEGKEFADSIGAFFVLTSAKTNIGINILYTKIAEEYANRFINNKIDLEHSDSIKLDHESAKTENKNTCC